MIPIIYCKKIKFLLEKYLLPKIKQNLIDSDSQKSFSKNNDTTIINLSVIPWNFRYQRPQQLATELAKNNIPVFYINNEFLVTKNLKNPPFTCQKIKANLFNIQLSSTNNYFIYQNSPNSVDIKIISNSIKNLIRTAKIKKPILKIDHPFWTPIALNLNLPFIYDCLDDQSHFELNSDSIIAQEKILFQKANKIFVTSQILLKKASQYRNSKSILLIPNATDYNHFSYKNEIDFRNNLSHLPKPLFGYFGAIEKWFDTDFIENLAKNTKGTIILIGKNNLNYQPLSKKILLLGEKSYQDLPQYLSQFNICLLPFKINSLTKAVNPVKIYEYFSQGKAVICSPLPELKPYTKLIYFYSPKTNLFELIEKIKDEKASLKLDRQKISQNNTWTHRAGTIISVLKTL